MEKKEGISNQSQGKGEEESNSKINIDDKPKGKDPNLDEDITVKMPFPSTTEFSLSHQSSIGFLEGQLFLLPTYVMLRGAMALGENPKKVATDVAEGLRTFNKVNLRRYEAPDLKVIVTSLNEAQRDIRMEIVGADDPDYTDKMKHKNQRMTRIRNTLTIIRSFVYRRNIKGVFQLL